MTQEELNEILEKHKKWLSNEDGGIRANLSGANLMDVDLRDANLSGANLSYVDLTFANLLGANLSNANLRSANITYADLTGANLSCADFSNAYLVGADLRGIDLSNADLRYAIGNNKEVKSLQLGTYSITILVDIKMHIGCQNHTIPEWENFTDEEISEMDDGALEWWKEWKEVILKVAKGK